MDSTLDFRSRLARRFVWIALMGVPSTVAVGSGCDGDVDTGDDATSSSASSMTSGSYTAAECFPWPQAGVGGAGGQGGSGQGGSIGVGTGGSGQGGSGQGGSTTSAGGQGGAPSPSCPLAADASQYIDLMSACGGEIVSEGTLTNGTCCYQVLHYDCVAGRPFLVEGRMRTAAHDCRDSGWEQAGEPRPDVSALSDGCSVCTGPPFT